MSQLDCKVINQQWPLAKEFRISRGAKTQADVIIVILSDGQHQGWAESVPYARYGETIESVTQQINDITPQLTNKITNKALLSLLPAGAARNALDCALWDLTAKRQHQSIVELTNQAPEKTLITAQTLSIDSVDNMAKEAQLINASPLIKVKLDDQLVIERMSAIHQAAPNARFIIDANEAWSFEQLVKWLPQLKPLNVALIEQPLAANNDDALLGFIPSIPLCADESCHTSDDLMPLKGKYQAINIKLDKTGGLTDALLLLANAKAAGFIIMTGCMVGTSLAMAPAFIIAQHAQFVDLDGPILLAKDRKLPFTFYNGQMSHMPSLLWGGISNDGNNELNELN